MKRKTLFMILSLSVCLAMTACSGSDQKETAETTQTAETKESETTEETAEAEETEEKAEEAEETEAEETEAAETEEEAAEPKGQYTEDFELSYDFKSCVTKLGAYTGLTVEVDPVAEIPDEAVQTEKDRRLSAIGTDEITEGKVETGDIANIDYVGKKDDVAFDGGTASGYDLTIGSGQFIPGFEDGLIGVEIGDTVDLNLTFPEEYHSEELAGAEVVFTVTVNSVQRRKELTDDLVKEFTEGAYETIIDYEAMVRADLEDTARKNQETAVFDKILTEVKNATEFAELPEEKVNAMADDYYNSYKTQSMMYGMEMEDFIKAYFGTSLEEFEKYTHMLAENTLQAQSMILCIAEDADLLEITEEDYVAACEEFVEEFHMGSLENLYVSADQESIRMEILVNRVQEYLVKNNSFTETKEDAEEVSQEEDAEVKEDTKEEASEADAAETVKEETKDKEADEETAEEETEEESKEETTKK